MKRDSRSRRVEEVERVAGGRRVEHEQVVAALVVELVQLLHRHVLLRAGHGVRQLLVDAVGEHRVARALVGGVRARSARRRCAWRRASSPTARRFEPARRTLGRRAPRCRARPGRASCEPPGRVDREHRHLQPARGHAQRDRGGGGGLAHAARARRRRTISLALEPVADAHSLRSSSRASRSSSSEAELGLEQVGQRDHRRARSLLSRRSCARCAARAAVLGQRGAQRPRAPRRPRSPSAASSRARLVGAEALGQHARSPPPRRRPCPARRAAARWSSIVSFTGISSGSATATTPVRLGSRRNSSMIGAWRRIGPTRAMSREGARRAQHRQPVAGGGRVHDHEVVRRRRSVRRWSCASSQILPIVTSSCRPGRGRGRSTGRSRLPPSRPAERPDCSWWRSYSSMRALGIDRHAEEARGAARSPWPCPLRAEHGRAAAAGRRPRTTIVRLPARAAARPRAAATVVLPTPPLPVTTTRRLSSRASTGDRLKDSFTTYE